MVCVTGLWVDGGLIGGQQSTVCNFLVSDLSWLAVCDLHTVLCSGRPRFLIHRGRLTRAPLGHFYNAPHWGGLFRAPPPPSDLRNYWTDSKNSSGIQALEKLSRENKFY